MTTTIGRWLLVALAIAGLAIAAPVVGAHGDEPTADDAPPNDRMAGATTHVAGHAGTGGVEHPGPHGGETTSGVAGGAHHHDGRDGQLHGAGDGHHDGRHDSDDHHDGRYGQGGGC